MGPYTGEDWLAIILVACLYVWSMSCTEHREPTTTPQEAIDANYERSTPKDRGPESFRQ